MLPLHATVWQGLELSCTHLLNCIKNGIFILLRVSLFLCPVLNGMCISSDFSRPELGTWSGLRSHHRSLPPLLMPIPPTWVMSQPWDMQPGPGHSRFIKDYPAAFSCLHYAQAQPSPVWMILSCSSASTVLSTRDGAHPCPLLRTFTLFNAFLSYLVHHSFRDIKQ